MICNAVLYLKYSKCDFASLFKREISDRVRDHEVALAEQERIQRLYDESQTDFTRLRRTHRQYRRDHGEVTSPDTIEEDDDDDTGDDDVDDDSDEEFDECSEDDD